jgi:hypothetical protein
MRQAGRAGTFVFIVRALSPTGALSGAIFISDSQDVCYAALDSQKAASAAGSEAGMDCGTALCEAGPLNPYGEALLRCVFARPCAPAPAAEARFGEKSGSQRNYQAVG